MTFVFNTDTDERAIQRQYELIGKIRTSFTLARNPRSEDEEERCNGSWFI
jgi:hypothetical protein